MLRYLVFAVEGRFIEPDGRSPAPLLQYRWYRPLIGRAAPQGAMACW